MSFQMIHHKNLELWGNHWEDIAVCGGMVSTAATVLLVVFIPKVVTITKVSLQSTFTFQVYLMTVWGAGREVGAKHLLNACNSLRFLMCLIFQLCFAGQVSLQLPATATSTLHTDTINFIRGQVTSIERR